eukprot:15089993-Alexandrium_andersonii.AAC.1
MGPWEVNKDRVVPAASRGEQIPARTPCYVSLRRCGRSSSKHRARTGPACHVKGADVLITQTI